jgi:phage/plasmid-like protein (TIGR03299 family)
MNAMAHDIFKNANGMDCMFVVGKREDAWHKLGQRCDDAVNWEQAMTLAGLDWQVIKNQNYARNPQGHVVPVSSYSIFRDTDGAELAANVGEGFTIKQNRECFQFVDDLLQDNGGAHYDSAGALGNGATIWCSVRVPRADIAVNGEDKHESYLVFTTAHDGSMAHTAALSSVRVVCRNTLRQALSTNTGILRIKHTKNANARFEDAKRTMDGVVMDAKKLEAKLQMLATRRVTRESMTAVMDRLFPKPADKEQNTTRRENILAEVLALYESNDRNAFPAIRGTGYNLLNAVTEYTDHYRTARITDAREGYSIDKARAENAVIGTGERLKSQALDVILESTNGAPVHSPIYSKPVTSTTGLLDAVIANQAS